MPKFFGPDTVLWCYSDKPASGYVFYAIALLAVVTAIWPFVKSPSKMAGALRGNLADWRQERDFDMLVTHSASASEFRAKRFGLRQLGAVSFALIRVIYAKKTRGPVQAGNSGAENGVHLCRSVVSRRPKKIQKKMRKKLASPWPLPLDRKFERQTAPFGRSKKV
jgi:hypothetical protein